MKDFERYITRTIKINKVTANCVDFENRTFVDKTFLVTGDFTDDEILKIINSKDKKILANSILSNEITEELYKASETDFINNGFTDPEKKEKNVRYVSRTIKHNIEQIDCADFNNLSFISCKLEYTGDIPKPDVLELARTRFYPLGAGKVKENETTETLYFLSEEDFLKISEKVNK